MPALGWRGLGPTDVDKSVAADWLANMDGQVGYDGVNCTRTKVSDLLITSPQAETAQQLNPPNLH